MSHDECKPCGDHCMPKEIERAIHPASVQKLKTDLERATHERDLWRAIAVRLLATATGLDTATVFAEFPTPPIEITDQVPAGSAVSNALVTWWLDLHTQVNNARGRHPMQPVYIDERGVTRFKPNKIIEWLFDTGKMDLNQIARMDFSIEDHEQVAQLLNYSISGYLDLSRVSEESAAEARRACEHVLTAHHRKDESP